MDDKKPDETALAIREMRTGAMVWTATGLGLGLLAAGVPIGLAVSTPALMYSLWAAVRSWRRYRVLRARRLAREVRPD